MFTEIYNAHSLHSQCALPVFTVICCTDNNPYNCTSRQMQSLVQKMSATLPYKPSRSLLLQRDLCTLVAFTSTTTTKKESVHQGKLNRAPPQWAPQNNNKNIQSGSSQEASITLPYKLDRSERHTIPQKEQYRRSSKDSIKTECPKRA